jgi:hypothetical protein
MFKLGKTNKTNHMQSRIELPLSLLVIARHIAHENQLLGKVSYQLEGDILNVISCETVKIEKNSKETITTMKISLEDFVSKVSAHNKIESYKFQIKNTNLVITGTHDFELCQIINKKEEAEKKKNELLQLATSKCKKKLENILVSDIIVILNNVHSFCKENGIRSRYGHTHYPLKNFEGLKVFNFIKLSEVEYKSKSFRNREMEHSDWKILTKIFLLLGFKEKDENQFFSWWQH